MSKLNLVGVMAILAFAGGVHVACAEEKPPDWKRLARLPQGERIAVTTAQGQRPAVFVSADASSLLIADLAEVPRESSRKAIAAAVREAPLAPVEGELDVKGVRARVVRIEREQVERVTRVSERASAGVVGVVVAAAVVGGFYLAQGIAFDNPWAGLGVLIATPLGAGVGAYHATKQKYTEELYFAPVRMPLGEADWRAVQDALPLSLRGVASRNCCANR